jgi:hypothetical protein
MALAGKLPVAPAAACLLVAAAVTAPARADDADRATVIVVVGAPGTPDYAKAFAQWADQWKQACAKGGQKHVAVGLDGDAGDKDLDKLHSLIDQEPKTGPAELWLVFIGHGTFDGRESKFNLRGPDVSADDLAAWLAPFERPVVVIDCASSSAPFINKLSKPGRVVVTATKSGYELNYARFGEHLAKSIADPAADLDKDGQTSLLEAFLAASRLTAEFYVLEGRLATEEALIDDNGDGKGTPADFFRGVHVVKQSKDGAAPDGRRARQVHLVRSATERAMPADARARRDDLELQIAALRDRKSQLSADAYYAELEPLLVQLATLYEEAERGPKGSP